MASETHKTAMAKSTRRRKLSVEDHIQGVLSGDRMILARTITLVESNHAAHRHKAQEVLQGLLPHTGNAHRVGITGVPGVGKSTFIESLGMHLLEQEYRVAVLAVDPTSSVRGGSILGDKTRMTQLSTDPRAFVRPSPTQGSLGGVHRKTRETMLLCEAAGYDVVLVETVGVGQSETAVADMVDSYLVLMLAGAGDELQGIKKGILEVADIITINKADGDNAIPAKRARQEYARALHFMTTPRSSWKTKVLTCSGLQRTGVPEVWETLQAHRDQLEETGELDKKRQQQRRQWMWSLVEQELMLRLRQHNEVAALVPKLEQQVLSGETPPTMAAEQILQTFGIEN